MKDPFTGNIRRGDKKDREPGRDSQQFPKVAGGLFEKFRKGLTARWQFCYPRLECSSGMIPD
jgi:hypothetical protein